MRRTGITLAIVSSLLILVSACDEDKGGGDGESGGEEEVEWPEKPADGAPLAFEFLALEGSGEDLAARVRVFNFADKDVSSFRGTLHYLDEGGEELKDFPWGQSEPGALVEAKAQAVVEVGAFVPEETKEVTVEAQTVEFADGSTWEGGD